jgi:hypothetical protein
MVALGKAPSRLGSLATFRKTRKDERTLMHFFSKEGGKAGKKTPNLPRRARRARRASDSFTGTQEKGGPLALFFGKLHGGPAAPGRSRSFLKKRGIWGPEEMRIYNKCE